ncbi:hypothetical protein HELRODRAFT_172064 [Helobdella robusta]|uniref:Uncharacterized protein n=1 Tax=Helobdella robusta TaxID=6412 RepID=T1F4Z8_HELRO|nr:hypothetical protein HELRODRAFT_172064 [Helobdella robusta]ESO05050.1 hypothetical protein HELRODRAFT_172064 [Helobdella robusta]
MASSSAEEKSKLLERVTNEHQSELSNVKMMKDREIVELNEKMKIQEHRINRLESLIKDIKSSLLYLCRKCDKDDDDYMSNGNDLEDDVDDDGSNSINGLMVITI